MTKYFPSNTTEDERSHLRIDHLTLKHVTSVRKNPPRSPAPPETSELSNRPASSRDTEMNVLVGVEMEETRPRLRIVFFFLTEAFAFPVATYKIY